MKITRKQYNEDGQLIERIVITQNATRSTFQNLQEKAWSRCEWSKMDIPSLTNTSSKCWMKTKSGNSFEFTLHK